MDVEDGAADEEEELRRVMAAVKEILRVGVTEEGPGVRRAGGRSLLKGAARRRSH